MTGRKLLWATSYRFTFLATEQCWWRDSCLYVYTSRRSNFSFHGVAAWLLPINHLVRGCPALPQKQENKRVWRSDPDMCRQPVFMTRTVFVLVSKRKNKSPVSEIHLLNYTLSDLQIYNMNCRSRRVLANLINRLHKHLWIIQHHHDWCSTLQHWQ